METKSKECTKCHEVKSIENFSNNKKTKDGKFNSCKECEKEKYRKAKKRPKEKVKEKECRKCSQMKKIQQFVKNKSRKDGYTNECKKCQNLRKKEDYRIKNRTGERKKGQWYTTQTFKEALFKNLGEDYELIGEYNSGQPIKIHHIACGETREVPSEGLTGALKNRCSNCINNFRSILSNKIENTLREIGANYNTEISFEGCRNKLPLSFDFVVYREDDIEIIIEADGEHHFKDSYGGKLKYVQKLDRIKNKYCKDNNIPLLRISYLQEDEADQIVKDSVLPSIHFKPPRELYTKSGIIEEDAEKIRVLFAEKGGHVTKLMRKFNFDRGVVESVLAYRHFPRVREDLKEKVTANWEKSKNPKRYYKDLTEEEQKNVVQDRLNLMNKDDIADKYNMYKSFNLKMEGWDDILGRKTAIGKRCRHIESGEEFTSLRQGCRKLGYIYGSEARRVTVDIHLASFEYI